MTKLEHAYEQIVENWNKDFEMEPAYGTALCDKILQLMHDKEFEKAAGLIVAWQSKTGKGK